MKITTVIDKNREEEIVIYLKEDNGLARKIEALLNGTSTEIIGYRDENMKVIRHGEAVCFTIIDSKVYCITENGRYRVKERLFELCEILGDNFVKINQSCLANTEKIKGFSASVTGSLKVLFVNGYTDYVSRRQLRTVKEKFGIIPKKR